MELILRSATRLKATPTLARAKAAMLSRKAKAVVAARLQ